MVAIGLACAALLRVAAASAELVSNAIALTTSRELALRSKSTIELLPGTIVGQGRYVLAEKLCDLYNTGPPTRRHEARQLPRPSDRLLLLPPPSDRLLLLGDGDQGQLVPYEGLAEAIARELPELPLLAPWEAPAFLHSVHEYSVSYVRGDPLFQEDTWRYRFGQRIGRGAFGEAWRAVSLDASMGEVVLKRLFTEHGAAVRRSGEREIYFGTVLQHRPHIARFIESFEHAPAMHAVNDSGETGPPELWLVFHNEGFSLTHHMFRVQPGSLVVEMSAFWWIIKRQQPVGGQVIKNIAYQLLHAMAVVHDFNITHRDIKGGNVFMTDTWPPVVRLGDWGSALVTPPTEEVRALYGPDGPTEDDETSGYQPPEVIFDAGVLARVGIAKAEAWREQAYDLWSFGVLLLELVLGTREVFKVDERRWLREEHALRRQQVSPELLPQARQLQALLDLCLAPPGVPRGTPLVWFFKGDPSPAAVAEQQPRHEPWCTDEEFAEKLQQRDAAGIGLGSRDGRDLLRRLLSWSPKDRIRSRDALAHRWFDDGAQLPPLKSLQPQQAAALDDEETEGEVEGGESLDDGDEAVCMGQALTEYDVVLGSGSLASTCPGLNLHAAAQSDIGWRSTMEDRHAVLNLSGSCAGKESYVAVFDGHSGSDVADRLQRSMHHHLVAHPAYPADIPRALRGAFGAFDNMLKMEAGWSTSSGSSSTAVAKASSGEVVPREPGSTALVALTGGCRLYLANLGDCRAVVARHDETFGAKAQSESGSSICWPLGALVEVRDSPIVELRGQRGVVVELRSPARCMYMIRLLRDGGLRPLRHNALRLLSELRAQRITEDHKPSSESERRRIEALGGTVEQAKGATGFARVAGIATSRSFGSLGARPLISAEPDLHELALEPWVDRFVVLASDGVWDVLDDQLVVDLVWEQLSSVHDSRFGPAAALEGAAQLIVQTALERGSLDNLTCVVLLMSWFACSGQDCPRANQ